jgi:methionine sulfoxide reductase heme-binding subunit
MTGAAVDPTQHLWWLMSRASGIVALGLITASVALGLAMANKLIRGRNVAGLHEHLSLAGLVAICVHGVTLLGDPWLHPGVSGIVVPFTMGYRTVFTGLGIIGGYLAAALGLSFYIRRKIGTKLWRKLHRFTVVAYVLSLVHAIGAGTDASTVWLRTFMVATAVPIGVMFVARMIPRRKPQKEVQKVKGTVRVGRPEAEPAA